MNLGRGDTIPIYDDFTEYILNEIILDKFDRFNFGHRLMLEPRRLANIHPLGFGERVMGEPRIRSFKFEEDLDLFEISFPLDKYSFDCTNIDPFMRFINEKNHIDDRIPHMYYVFKYDFVPKDIRLVTKRIRDIEANLNILSRVKFHGYLGDKYE